jgi:phosphatidylserine/phosphatidylglycerophosphate/cardiolipin synthase-like enzyme
MTVPIPLGVTGARVQLLSDQGYLPALTALVDTSVHRCLCSMFIVDVSPLRDRALKVDSLLSALAAARWRGVDVRLLIGGSRDNLDIAETADVARARAGELGIPARWTTSAPRRGTHVKLVVVDDSVLTGSHNWSGGAFGSQVQDSLVVASPDLAAYLASLFERQWAAAGAP